MKIKDSIIANVGIAVAVILALFACHRIGLIPKWARDCSWLSVYVVFSTRIISKTSWENTNRFRAFLALYLVFLFVLQLCAVSIGFFEGIFADIITATPPRPDESSGHMTMVLFVILNSYFLWSLFRRKVSEELDHD